MTVLRGPADADHYRVKVGRYGDRWYTDPLPSCPIAEASDWQGPSWSIVKGAAGKDWSYVTNKRNGHTAQAELERIAKLEPDARTAAFNQINKTGLTQAGGRGTIVHLWAEDLLAGRSPRGFPPPALFALKLPAAAFHEALDYLPALTAFFDHYQPEVIAAEYVALHRSLNGHGYGCTPDVVARIQGQVLAIDWKSRGVDSDHGAYPEEAAQIAAGACADYMIITGPDGTPQRARLPKIDAGIVVSIRPDGCRIYPTDINLGYAHVQAMHAFWVARLTEKDSIGKPWAPTPTNQENLWTTSTSTKPSTEPSAQDTPSQPSKSLKPVSPATKSTAHPASSTTTTTPATTPFTKSETRAATSADTTTGTTAASPTTPSSPSDPPDDLSITSRILADAMSEWPERLRQYLKDWWPTDCPTPGQVRRGEAVWTDQQITNIGVLCDLGDAPFWHQSSPELGRFAGAT